MPRAVTLWTTADSQPVQRCLYEKNRAFTLWGGPQAGLQTRFEPVVQSRAFSIWTAGDFSAQKRILFPRSEALGIWTEQGWAPQQVRGVLPESRAFSIWTEKGWKPLWSASGRTTTVFAKKTSTVMPSESNVIEPVRRSVFSRAFAVAKNTLGLKALPVKLPPPPQQQIQSPQISPPVIEAMPVPVPAVKKPAATPVLHPRSQAFTIWTEAAWRPAPPRVFIPPVPIFKEPAVEKPEPPVVKSAANADNAEVHYKADIESSRVRYNKNVGIIFNAAPRERDDLTELKGIGEVIAYQLHALGIYTFKQIALWTDAQAHEISHRLAFKDRVFREHWIEQARELHFAKYAEKL